MTMQKLNIASKVDNAAKKQMVQSNAIGANETLMANEVNAMVAKMNELVEAYNLSTPITAFNFKENVPTYADLPLTGNQVNDGYGVLDKGLVYVWNGLAFPPLDKGLDLGLKPNGTVEAGNAMAVSGDIIFKNNFLKLFYNKGKYVAKSNGLLVDNSNYKTTGFLKINHTEDIFLLATESALSTPIAFFDADFNFISSIVEGTSSTREFTIKKKGSSGGNIVPDLAEFLIANCNINQNGNIFSGIDFGYYLRSEKKIKTADYFTLGGYINNNNGLFVSNTTYKSTELLKLNKKVDLEVLAYKSAASVGGVYFYDKNKNYIHSLFDNVASPITGKITWPENTEYYRVSALVSQRDAFVTNSTDVFLLEELVKNSTSETSKNEKLDIGDLFSRKGYYLGKDTGNEIPNVDYNCTDYLPLDLNNDLKIRVSGSGTSAAAYAFYDKDKKPLLIHFPGNTAIIDTTILKSNYPVGAVYFRANARPSVLSNPHVNNITVASLLKTQPTTEQTSSRTLKVMNIGSSHGIDLIQSFPKLAQQAGVNIKCANLYTGGIRLSEILNNCINNIDFQIYSINENGFSWKRDSTGVGTRTVLNALQSEKWDIIILQRSAYNTNTWMQSQKESLYGIIKYINDNVDYKPKILFSLGHPPAVGNASTPTLVDQNQWYLDSVAGALQMQKDWYLDIIPTGTAVQNARSTFLRLYGTGENQDLCRDLLHLDTGIGTYITGCVLFEYIIGKRFDLSILTNKYIPLLSDISGILGSASTFTLPTERMAEVARYCAMAAIKNPYEVSENLAINFEN